MRLSRNTRAAKARRGLTALEMTVATALLLLTARISVTAIGELQSVTSSADTSTRLQEAGQRALLRIVDDLRRSGAVTVGGKAFPYVFTDGAAQPPFEDHAHAAAIRYVAPDGSGVSSSREIVFAQPLDADPAGQPGHGVPDVDGAGRLAWEASEFSYVVVSSGGRNVLQRRVDAGSPELICAGVESVRFDTSLTSPVSIPANAISVQLAMRGRDSQGQIVRYTARAVVRMRNR